ncbi:hypothetical protein [Brevibacterium ihuae]|uniref:hypothetical protein n=1 Tax=Brevibacterium ihuae TaxID=1631743 RepID=UPI000C767DCC|nr:hypothetical protein [Brevibacterium ihuae]
MKQIIVPQVITRARAGESGHTSYEIRNSPAALRPFRGAVESTRATEIATVPHWADEEWVALFRRARVLQSVRPQAVFCSLTAAQLTGLPLPPRLRNGPLHVIVPGTSRVRLDGVVGHRTQRVDPIDRFGLRINHPGFVLAEVAGLTSPWNLVQICDALMGKWHGPPVVSHPALTDFLNGHTRFRGRRRLLAALAEAREGVDSPRETDIRLTIVRAGLPEPRVHPRIRLPSGAVIEPDLGYEDRKVVLEYEGRHHREEAQWQYDIGRYDELRDLGYLVIRITAGMTDRDWLPRLRRALW